MPSSSESADSSQHLLPPQRPIPTTENRINEMPPLPPRLPRPVSFTAVSVTSGRSQQQQQLQQQRLLADSPSSLLRASSFGSRQMPNFRRPRSWWLCYCDDDTERRYLAYLHERGLRWYMCFVNALLTASAAATLGLSGDTLVLITLDAMYAVLAVLGVAVIADAIWTFCDRPRPSSSDNPVNNESRKNGGGRVVPSGGQRRRGSNGSSTGVVSSTGSSGDRQRVRSDNTVLESPQSGSASFVASSSSASRTGSTRIVDRSGNDRFRGGDDSGVANANGNNRQENEWSSSLFIDGANSRVLTSIGAAPSSSSFAATRIKELLQFLPTFVVGTVTSFSSFSRNLNPKCATGASALLSPSPAERARLCQGQTPNAALFVMLLTVVNGRPRGVLTVPFLMLVAALFPCGVSVTTIPDGYESTIVSLTLLVVFTAAAISALCIFRERAQRDEFDLYEWGICAVEEANAAIEARAAHLRRLLPPLLHTRVISGARLNVSRSATVVAVQIDDFQAWFSKMLHQRGAVVCAQLSLTVAECATRAGVDQMRAVGDSYVLTANLLQEAPNHVHQACTFALSLRGRVSSARVDHPAVVLRQSVATGYVVGAVLGERFLRYDVFGSTVTEAADLLYSCPPGGIVCSATVEDCAAAHFEFAPPATPPHSPTPSAPPSLQQQLSMSLFAQPSNGGTYHTFPSQAHHHQHPQQHTYHGLQVPSPPSLDAGSGHGGGFNMSAVTESVGSAPGSPGSRALALAFPPSVFLPPAQLMGHKKSSWAVAIGTGRAHLGGGGANGGSAPSLPLPKEGGEAKGARTSDPAVGLKMSFGAVDGTGSPRRDSSHRSSFATMPITGVVGGGGGGGGGGGRAGAVAALAGLEVVSRQPPSLRDWDGSDAEPTMPLTNQTDGQQRGHFLLPPQSNGHTQQHPHQQQQQQQQQQPQSQPHTPPLQSQLHRLYSRNRSAVAAQEALEKAERDLALKSPFGFLSLEMESAFQNQPLPRLHRVIPSVLVAAFAVLRLIMMAITSSAGGDVVGASCCLASAVVIALARAMAALHFYGRRDVSMLVDATVLAALVAAVVLIFVGAALLRPAPATNDLTYIAFVATSLFGWSTAIHTRCPPGVTLGAFALCVVVPLSALCTMNAFPEPFSLAVAGVACVVLFPLFVLHGHILGRLLFRAKLLNARTQRVLEEERAALGLIVDSFPKVVASFTQRHRVQGMGVVMLCDTTATCIRFDGLALSYTRETDAIALASAVDAAIAALDEAVQRHGTVVGCVNVFGDTALIAGPLQEKQDAMGAVAVRACRETLDILYELRKRRVRFTAAATMDTCFAVVANADYPTFDLLGRAVNVSRQVVNAAAPGSIVCNEQFATFYQCPNSLGAGIGQDPPPQRFLPSEVFFPARQWRIRSLGMLLLHAVRFPGLSTPASPSSPTSPGSLGFGLMLPASVALAVGCSTIGSGAGLVPLKEQSTPEIGPQR